MARRSQRVGSVESVSEWESDPLMGNEWRG